MRSAVLVALCFALPSAMVGQTRLCKTATFMTTMSPEREFSKDLGSSLSMRLSPLNQRWGWTVIVSPSGASSEDWTYPVNMPLRTGESQLIGTGYGDTVRKKLQYSHSIRFLLTEPAFTHYSRRATEALTSRDSGAAGKYLSELPKAVTGIITITPLESKTSGDGERVYWARLRFQVTVPSSFGGSPKLDWHSAPCPAAWPAPQ